MACPSRGCCYIAKKWSPVPGKMTKFFRLVDKMPGGGKMWVRSIFLGCFGTKNRRLVL